MDRNTVHIIPSKEKIQQKTIQKESKPSLAVKVARLAGDLKLELKLAHFYNNAAVAGTVGACDVVGESNGTGLGIYISTHPIMSLIEEDDDSQ